ncbi:MAG: hypothetical protein ACQEXX_02970 [Bacillota bacterium]
MGFCQIISNEANVNDDFSGTMIGSYIGAKFTSRAPKALLRFAMIAMPILGSKSYSHKKTP